MELYIEPIKLNRNPKTGKFLRGSVPHNKGKKMTDYMDESKAAKVKRIGLKNLRSDYNVGGWNSREVVAIRNGRFAVFKSSEEAGRKLGIIARNIRQCCDKKRKHAGGLRFFWEDDNSWTSLIQE